MKSSRMKLDIIQSRRSLRMAGDEYPLPRRQAGENLFPQRFRLPLQRLDLPRQVDPFLIGERAELLYVLFQLYEGLFPTRKRR